MSDSPVTLITGGSSGIGAATARLLLDRGHRVAVTGRDSARLDAFAASVGPVLTFPGDASSYEDVVAAVEGTLKEYGRLDAVVANAGFSSHDTLADGDPEGWREMILTNVLGPAVLIRASLAALKQTRGRIVLMGSVAGFQNTPGNIYSVTKWAITGMAENTRRMVTADGVGVTLVAPGRVETPFWGSGGPPEGGLLTSGQIAEAILWALSQPAGVDVNTLVVRPIGQNV